MAYNSFDLESLPISELRKLCSVEKIEFEKASTKEDLIRLLNNRRKGRMLARLVTSEDQEIPRGFVRLKIALNRDGSDTPVPVMVNNFKSWIPRNVVVDIPKEAFEVLKASTESATQIVMDKEGNKALKVIEVPCYPFEKMNESVGVSGAVRPATDVRTQRLREQYRERNGKWPSRLAFAEFKSKFIDEMERAHVKQIVAEENQE